MADENTISNTEDIEIKAPQYLSLKDIREEVVINEGDGSLIIETDVSPVISYALYVNGTHLVKEVHVTNTTEKDISDLNFQILNIQFLLKWLLL